MCGILKKNKVDYLAKKKYLHSLPRYDFILKVLNVFCKLVNCVYFYFDNQWNESTTFASTAKVVGY